MCILPLHVRWMKRIASVLIDITRALWTHLQTSLYTYFNKSQYILVESTCSFAFSGGWKFSKMFLFLYCFLVKTSFFLLEKHFEAGFLLNFFLIFGDFRARCSYKIVLIKNKKCISPHPTNDLETKTGR